VEARCTCGAVLPDAARFCHKCGKPQFEEDVVRLAAAEESHAVPVPPPPSAAAPPIATGISFKDSRAVGITIIAAILAFLGLMIVGAVLPGLAPVLLPIVLLAAGFIVPAAYRRRTTQPLTTAAGARLGWMTGVWFFLGGVIIASLMMLILSTPAGAAAMQQLQSNPQFAQMKISSPHDLMTSLLMSALPTFLLVTLLPGVGGMIGARFWGK
jgi:hypothetical protein